jgi:hypothetical protein
MAFAGGARHGLAYVLPHIRFANFSLMNENRPFVGEISWVPDRSNAMFRPGDNPVLEAGFCWIYIIGPRYLE